MQRGRHACDSMQASAGPTAVLLLLLVLGTAVPCVRCAVTDPQGFPDSAPAPQLLKTAAAPEQARQCLLKAFKSSDAHMKERKVRQRDSCCCAFKLALPHKQRLYLHLVPLVEIQMAEDTSQQCQDSIAAKPHCSVARILFGQQPIINSPAVQPAPTDRASQPFVCGQTKHLFAIICSQVVLCFVSLMHLLYVVHHMRCIALVARVVQYDSPRGHRSLAGPAKQAQFVCLYSCT